MTGEAGFLAAVLPELAASTVVFLAAWGALRSATNALATRMRLRDAPTPRAPSSLRRQRREAGAIRT